MYWRSFVSVLSITATHPVIPNRLNPAHPPAIPSEGSVVFWYHFYSAIERERSMSTEEAREQAVNEPNLTNLADNEAVHRLKLANERVYNSSGMPERWHGVSEEFEENLSRGASKM